MLQATVTAVVMATLRSAVHTEHAPPDDTAPEGGAGRLLVVERHSTDLCVAALGRGPSRRQRGARALSAPDTAIDGQH